jgi:hypothetical protein
MPVMGVRSGLAFRVDPADVILAGVMREVGRSETRFGAGPLIAGLVPITVRVVEGKVLTAVNAPGP